MTAASGPYLFSFEQSAAKRSAALLRKLDAGRSTRAIAPIKPVDDDDGYRGPDRTPMSTTPRTDAEILARCAQLRAVLAAARARREAQQ